VKVKFYVGEMRSDYATIHGLTEEVHFLTRLDYVYEVTGEKGIADIDAMLRTLNREFIRSDSDVRTYVALDIFNEVQDEQR
jgi:hypothetical protein